MLHIPLLLGFGLYSGPAPSLGAGGGALPVRSTRYYTHTHFSKHPSHAVFLAWERKDLKSLADWGRQNLHLALSLTCPLYHFPIQDTRVCPVLMQLKIGQEEEDSQADSLMLQGPLSSS